jgi:CRISPR-associated protein Cas1
MQNRIVDISADFKTLSLRRGFLRVIDKNDMVAPVEIPLDTICSVFVSGNAANFTQDVCAKLCEYKIPLFIIGKNYCPVGVMMPLIGKMELVETQFAQIKLTKAVAGKIWQTIIQVKISRQSKILDKYDKENQISKISKFVDKNDDGNLEAVAAKLYFQSLFDKGFVRDRNALGINAALNYGYAIIRACVARFAVASGLNVAFGIKHSGRVNPMCLVDDLMEIYRPIVDGVVYELFNKQNDKLCELTIDMKKQLAGILEMKLFKGSNETLSWVIQQDVWGFVNSIIEKKNLLNYADIK